MEPKYQPVNCVAESLNHCNKLKVTVVGDANVGITSMLVTYILKKFPSEATPTTIDEYKLKSTVENKKYDISFWNVSSYDGYEHLRMLTYRNVNCVVVCFSVNDRTSFASVLYRWLPEIEKHCQHVPVILVGTKADLRLTDDNCITLEEADEMREGIGATEYIECSALADDNLRSVFEQVIEVSIQKEKYNCAIL